MTSPTKGNPEHIRQEEPGRRDKGDDGFKKIDKTKGADNQVAIPNGGQSRDAVKEDRG